MGDGARDVNYRWRGDELDVAESGRAFCAYHSFRVEPHPWPLAHRAGGVWGGATACRRAPSEAQRGMAALSQLCGPGQVDAMSRMQIGKVGYRVLAGMGAALSAPGERLSVVV